MEPLESILLSERLFWPAEAAAEKELLRELPREFLESVAAAAAVLVWEIPGPERWMRLVGLQLMVL